MINIFTFLRVHDGLNVDQFFEIRRSSKTMRRDIKLSRNWAREVTGSTKTVNLWDNMIAAKMKEKIESVGQY